MTYDELLSQVAERAGLSGRQEAEQTVHAVLGVLAGHLRWPDVRALGEDLPAPLAERLRRGAHGEDFDLATLHARVSRREGVRPGFAVEHTGVVCQVVAEALGPAGLHRLQEALPGPMAALFTPREPPGPPAHLHRGPHPTTLAEGRPGSRHPLSEARPERAHTHSLVREDNPHGETKLSSATGLTQEREQETLATGRPGSSRPLSGAD